jgi:hypothetical protein
MEDKRGSLGHPRRNRICLVPYTSIRRLIQEAREMCLQGGSTQTKREKLPSMRQHPNNNRKYSFKEVTPKHTFNKKMS